MKVVCEPPQFELGLTNKSPDFLAKFPLGKVCVCVCVLGGGGGGGGYYGDIKVSSSKCSGSFGSFT